jgi:phenylalanyl-tRNA synthetase beta chain
MTMLDFAFRESPKAKTHHQIYWIEQLEDPTYFHGQAASIHVSMNGKEQVVGQLGVLHPTVLKNFELSFVVSALEMNLEAFL